MKTVLSILFCTLSMVLWAQTPTNTYKPGSKAIDFNLKGVDGKMHTLSEFKDAKGFMVIFTCNHCPFSQAYEDRIIALHKKYAPLGIPVIAINPNDSVLVEEDNFEHMVLRAKEHQYPFVYLQDETQKIARAYGAVRTPHVFFIDSSLLVKYVGAIDDNFEEPSLVKQKYLEDALDAFLAGKTIALTQTKAIGCGIKWKR